MPKKMYFLANWKMYLDLAESVALAQGVVENEKVFPAESVVGVFPSALSFTKVSEIFHDSHFSLGAQNTYWIDKGGYTGEVSAAMYKSVGAKYALVGHAERRHLFNEGNHEVRQKLEGILHAHLTPVICIGETLQEKKGGLTEEVLEAQLRAAFTDLQWPAETELIIAYEPVWAIGTGESCDAEEAEKVSKLIFTWTKELLKSAVPHVVYGGSVRPENIVGYMKQLHIEGVLVGGASTKLASLLELMKKLGS